MTWEQHNKRISISGNKDKSILDEFLKLQSKYKDDIHYYDYPAKVFYTSTSFYWLTEQLKEFYREYLPFVLIFIKEGVGNWEFPFHIGPAEKVMKEIEEKRWNYLKKNQVKVDKAILKFNLWLKKNRKIEENRDLDYYLKKLNEACQVLVDIQIYFQISTQIDELLRKKLVSLFPGIEESSIFSLCVSDKKADVHIHDEKVRKFIEEECENLKDFESLDRKTKQKLLECYNFGYFLYSGYGGVTLWSLEDEYNKIKDITKERITHDIKNKKESIKLNEEQKFWIEVGKYFSALRDQRKSIQQKSFYYQALLLEKLGKIIGHSREDLENLRVDQIINLADKKEISEIIKKQKIAYLLCWTYNTSFYIEVGSDAKKTYEKYKSKRDISIEEISGQVASQGIAQGVVRVIFNVQRKFTFNEGDILVTGMTSPDFVPLMKKASAIVTDLGGITCHAAIISREFNKPCIIGTKNATKILKDEDLVEVNANEGIVKVIKRK